MSKEVEERMNNENNLIKLIEDVINTHTYINKNLMTSVQVIGVLEMIKYGVWERASARKPI